MPADDTPSANESSRPSPNPSPPRLPRRRFLRRFFAAAGGVAGAGVALAGCGGENAGGSSSPDDGNAGGGNAQNAQEAANTCVPPSELSEEARQGRQRYEYVAQTPQPGKRCNNCQFWVPAEAGATCGGCRLFAGPVHPQGYCNAYLAG